MSLLLERFETLIQLGAGLNSGYATVELILREPLLGAIKRHTELVKALEDRVDISEIERRFKITATTYNKLKPHLTRVSWIGARLYDVDALFSLISLAFCMAIIYQASVCPSCTIADKDAPWILVPAFGWLTISLICMGASRIYLDRCVTKHLRS